MTPGFSEELALFVCRQRKANRLSQTRLALLAGVGRRLVRDIEEAKATVQLNKVQAVLAVFGHSLRLGAVGRDGLPGEIEHA